MNLYVLVEGKVTEMRIYSSWLTHLLPGMKRVLQISDVRHNNFYLFSGYGYPNIMRRMVGCVMDINRHANIDYLVICLDAEESTVDKRYKTIMKRLDSLDIKLNPRTKVKVIIHNHCIETWFLGNKSMEIYPSNVRNHKLRLMIEDYNIFQQDPEHMPINHRIDDCTTIAQYHYSYLKHLFNECRLSYTKKNPGDTVSRKYLEQLIERCDSTKHLKSFAFFLHFCKELKIEMRAEKKKIKELKRQATKLKQAKELAARSEESS